MSAFGLTTFAASGTGSSNQQGGGNSNNPGGNNGDNGSANQRRPPKSRNKKFDNRQPSGQQQQQPQQQQTGGSAANKNKTRVRNTSKTFNENHTNTNNRKASNKTATSTRANNVPSSDHSSQSPLPTTAADPEYIVQTKMAPTKANMMHPPDKIHDQFIGALFPNAESLGFVRLPFKQNQELPNYLIQEEKFLERHEFRPDPWDIANQQKMLQLEEQTSDTTELMDTLEQMRAKERTEMENKGLVDKANVSKSLADAIVFRGSCLYMCPVFEKVKRRFNGDLSKYEKVGDNLVAIKTFSRSEAGQAPQLPSDVRPPHVLVQTLDYMVDNLIDKLPECEAFFWNRTRSIRQDFTYQNYFGPETVYCIEKICRIHILTLHVMAGSEVEYSQQQEVEQLNKSLETLNEIYDDLRKINKPSPNEAEFRSYYLISYYDKPELDQMIQDLPDSILASPMVQNAIMFRGLLLQNNTSDRVENNLPGGMNFFTQFFNAVFDNETPFFIACLLETHFNEIRFYALKSASGAYHSGGKPYHAAQLSEMLGFDDVQELVAFAEYYELKMAMDNDQLCVYLSPFKYNYVKDKEKLKQSYSKRLGLKMSGMSYKEIINSGVQIAKGEPQSYTANIPPVPVIRTTKDTMAASSKPKLAEKVSHVPGPEATHTWQAPKQVQPQERAPVIMEVPQAKLKTPATQIEKAPVAPAPVPKPKKLVDNTGFPGAAQQVYDDILQRTVATQLQELLPRLLKEESVHRQHDSLVSSLSLELYDAFMREMIHEVTLERMAHNFRLRRLEKLIVSTVSGLASQSLKKVQLRREKANEFAEFTNRTVPMRVATPILAKKRTPTPMMAEAVKRRAMLRAGVKSQSPQVKRDTDFYENIWKPVDFSEIFWKNMHLGIPNGGANADRQIKLKMLIVVKDWAELSARWLMSKLRLSYDQSKMTFVKSYDHQFDEKVGLTLEISGIPDKFDSKFFQQVGFLMFEFGLPGSADGTSIMQKLRSDRKVLRKVLSLVRQSSCFSHLQVAVFFYDSTKSGVSIEQVGEQLEIAGSGYDLKLFDMRVPQLVSTKLEECLTTVSKGFELTLQDSSFVEPAGKKIDVANKNGNANVKRIQFLKGSMMKHSKPIRLASSSSASASFSRSPSEMLTQRGIFEVTMDRSVTKNNILTTSTPMAGGISHSRSVLPTANNGDKTTKLSELRQLTASILSRKK